MASDPESLLNWRLLAIGDPPLASFVAAEWRLESRRELPSLAGLTFDVCVVVSDSTLRANGGVEGIQPWLTAAHTQGVPAILVYDDLSVDHLADLVRAGLFDALPREAADQIWRDSLDRAARHLRVRADDEAIQAESAATQRLLQAGRRRVQNEVAAEAASLLATQTELEEVNQRLGNHMAQISLLYRFGRQLSLASNWDDTLRDILANLAQFVGAVGGALVLRTARDEAYAPRQTYRWDEKAWDKVLLRITAQIDTGVASSLLAPGIFQVGRETDGDGGRIAALPLENRGARLGMLLLLFADPEDRERQTGACLPFLQMVQVMLSEEVSAAQMLDRLRDVSTFNTRVLETVSSAIWVCDSTARTIFANRTARAMLGLDESMATDDSEIGGAVGRGRMLERPLTGGAALDDLPEIFLEEKLRVDGGDEPLHDWLLAREASYVGEGHVVAADGRTLPVRVRTAPMAGRGSDDQWLLLVLEDLSETRRAEAARRRADQLEQLVAMSATLAHEIRNPLMGLSAQAELLADSLPAADSRRDRIDLITGEVERINQTIDDMLRYVRPCRPRRETVDLVVLARNCLELARPRAQQQVVSLAADGPPTLLVEADPAQLQQVVLNLVLNAVDAAPADGEVRVTMAAVDHLPWTDPDLGFVHHGPGYEIRVEDNGPGFGDLDREQLFQPFFTTKTTGTGLGLSYSRKVVEAHDGEIRAERQGAWTCMRVLLPRATAVSAELAGEAS